VAERKPEEEGTPSRSGRGTWVIWRTPTTPAPGSRSSGPAWRSAPATTSTTRAWTSTRRGGTWGRVLSTYERYGEIYGR